MKLTWVFEKNVFEEDAPDLMRAAAIEQGHSVLDVTYVPFGGGFQESDDMAKIAFDSNPKIFYGSLNGCLYLNNIQSEILKFGLWADFDRLRCQYYYPYYSSENLLQKQYCFMPLLEIPHHKAFLFSHYGGEDGRLFIRPDDIEKSFHGGIVSYNEFDNWFKNATFYDPPIECLAVVSRHNIILEEWRLIIADKRVVASSLYKNRGKERLEQGINYAGTKTFAESMASIFSPHRVFCMDICCLANGNLAIVEIGSFNGAGMYKCDPQAIVKHVSQVAIDEFDNRQ